MFPQNCAPHQTLRRDPEGKVAYRFDHLLPGHFYHLDLSLAECDGAGREEAVYVDGNQLTGLVSLADGQPHCLSLRLDPALYADHTISATVQAPGIDGAVVGTVALHDVDYRYVDAGAASDLQYTAARGYGWLDGVANTSFGTLPYQSLRVTQTGNTLRYRYDGLQPGREYAVHMTFYQYTGPLRVEKIQIDGVDTGTVVNVQSGQVYSATVTVPPASCQADGSVVVGIVRTNSSTGAMVNEIALEERTQAACAAEWAPSTVTLQGPATGLVGTSYAFTATVSPPAVSLPLTYTWEATGLEPLTHADVAAASDTAAFAWSVPGLQAVTVTVSNAAGSTQGSHSVNINPLPVQRKMYLPLVLRGE